MSASLKVLASLSPNGGAAPQGRLLLDSEGDLFGTSAVGSANGDDGEIFDIPYSAATGYVGVAVSVATFLYNGTQGASPQGNLIADSNGDLFGTTYSGGANGDGEIFEIAKGVNGYAGTPSIVVSFNGTDGKEVGKSLIADANGDLFGTTGGGGANGDGTVFELVKTASGYASAPTILASFNGSDGAFPASLIADAQGDLFGVTANGGADGDGAVFEIAKTANGYASAPTVLASLDGTDGRSPQGDLVMDANGDLLGTAEEGGTSVKGTAFGGGTVFEIIKTAGVYASTPTVLVSFNGTDGQSPSAGLTIDADGDLFGTTASGGANGDGTVFEIAKVGLGYATTPAMVLSFNGTDGSFPVGDLTVDAQGNLFGTAEFGGTNGDGTVFEVTQSGFAPGPEVFSQVQAAASGLLANNFLWSNAANWTDGVPVNGDTAASHAPGVDDIAALTLNSLDLTDGGAVTVVAPILTIETLVGDSTTQLLADSAIPGSASTDIVIVDDIAATGGSYGAVGPDTAFTDTSATSPANASYTAADDGKLQVTNDLAVGGTAVGNLSVTTGGMATSVNGTIGTGTANAGVVVVDGAQSSWVMSGSLGIGVQGGAGAPSLTIADDASVTTTSNVNSYDYFYNGSLTIETGATLTQTSLDMHNAATLVVESGAVLNETGDSDSDGLDPNGTVTFNDGTLVSPNADTTIGVATGSGGSGAGTLTASDGSVLTSFATALGYLGGDSGTLVLTGGTTRLTDTGGTGIDANSAGLNVGLDGTGSVTIEAGATLTNPLAYIKVGQFAGSGTVLVTGSGSTLSAGGLLRVGDSGTGTLTAANGATVAAGQVQVSDYGNSVGTLDIDSGASLSTNSASTVNVGPQRIANNGTIDVAAGSFDIGVQGGSKGRVDVDGGTVTVQGDLTVGNVGAGSLSVEGGGVFSAVNADIGTATGAGSVTLGVGGELIATAVHVGALGVVNMAGGVLDPPDTITIDAAGDISGYGTVTGSVVDNGSITATGGTLDLTGDVSGDGTLILTPDASLQLEGTIANTASIVFTGSQEALILGAAADVEAPISGLGDGDSFAIEGQSVTSAVYDPDSGQLAITGSGGAVFMLTLAGAHQQSDFSVVDGDVAVACFASGTRIATAHGDVRVESLAIGDSVRTRLSGLARIKWIGHRHIDCRRHPNPRKVWPVRVRAGAFGDGAPCRDLFLSPDHAVFVDDVLIPIRYLTNGSTIVQQPRDAVTYFHVELERHDVIFAEGLACETYLDTGHRSTFEGTPIALHPDFSAWSWEARGCAPLVITGPVLEAVRRRLRTGAHDRHGADCRAGYPATAAFASRRSSVTSSAPTRRASHR